MHGTSKSNLTTRNHIPGRAQSVFKLKLRSLVLDFGVEQFPHRPGCVPVCGGARGMRRLGGHGCHSGNLNAVVPRGCACTVMRSGCLHSGRAVMVHHHGSLPAGGFRLPASDAVFAQHAEFLDQLSDLKPVPVPVLPPAIRRRPSLLVSCDWSQLLDLNNNWDSLPQAGMRSVGLREARWS
eukprot:600277-Rhodomonas_salina.1